MRRRKLAAELKLNRRLISGRLGMVQQDVAVLAAATGLLARVITANTGAVMTEASRIGAESSTGLGNRAHGGGDPAIWLRQ